MKILFHRNFENNYVALRASEKKKLNERIAVFMKDPFDPALGNHALKGKHHCYRSIRTGGDLRAVYKSINKEGYLFVAIGTHARLYGF